MHLNVNHALLNNMMQKKSQKFENFGVIHNDSRFETCDLWLTCNWLNQNIKSLNDVKFEIKS
jgi:hypothetical protein